MKHVDIWSELYGGWLRWFAWAVPWRPIHPRAVFFWSRGVLRGCRHCELLLDVALRVPWRCGGAAYGT